MLKPTLRRRQEVLAAAENLFARQGYHATSVRDIANALNIKGGSLYAYIETKEDLLWSVLMTATDRYLTAANIVIKSDLKPAEKLRRIIESRVRLDTMHAQSASICSTQWQYLETQRRERFAQRRDQYDEIVRTLVRNCIRDGDFEDVDECLAARLILASINQAHQWDESRDSVTPEQTARKLTDMLFNGLRSGNRTGNGRDAETRLRSQNNVGERQRYFKHQHMCATSTGRTKTSEQD